MDLKELYDRNGVIRAFLDASVGTSVPKGSWPETLLGLSVLRVIAILVESKFRTMEAVAQYTLLP